MVTSAPAPQGSSRTPAKPSPVQRALDRYVRTAPSPALDSVRRALWAPSGPVRPEESADDRALVLEQYKIYVEMADRVSARRGLANTFFLTLNTAIFTLIGVFWQHPAQSTRALVVVPWLVLVGQCLAWFWLLRSYRQLNSAKYAVVGALEERLPASPYWAAEWEALGHGEDPSRYWPLSHVEQVVPAFFATAYTVGLVVLLLA
jgi:hypothetical protein